jgi:hypothetical protein
MNKSQFVSTEIYVGLLQNIRRDLHTHIISQGSRPCQEKILLLHCEDYFTFPIKLVQ